MFPSEFLLLVIASSVLVQTILFAVVATFVIPELGEVAKRLARIANAMERDRDAEPEGGGDQDADEE